MTTHTAPTADPLPCDEDAERATLGSIILDRDAIIPIHGWLFAEFFYWDKNGTIYQAMCNCLTRGTPADLVTLKNELIRMGKLDAVGGVPYLMDLANATPTAVHVEYHAKIVARLALHRKLIAAGAKITALGHDLSDEDFGAALDKAEAELFAVAQRKQTDGLVKLDVIVDAWFAEVGAQLERGEPALGLKTGFNDYDRLTGGLQKSDLVILAARPAVGKSSLMMNVAYHAALHELARVAIFSLEMSRKQLMQRLLATHTGIDMQKLRTGQIRDDDLHALTEAMGVLSSLPIYIDDTPGCTPMDIRSKCRRMQAEAGIDLIIVDYIQLMSGTYKRGGEANRVQEVSEISRGLKALAREADVPVLALSQLSRAVESRTSHVPMLSDLRESGGLEQDADQVLFIYREELYDPDTDKKGIAELHIAKQRNGPTGVVPLRFFKSTTRFANLETYRQPEGHGPPPPTAQPSRPEMDQDWADGWEGAEG